MEIHRARGDLLRQGIAFRKLANQLGQNGALAEAKAAGAEAVTVLEQLPPGPELARAYNTMATVLGTGDDDAAVRWGRKAIELAERVGCLDAAGNALNIVGTVELRQGNLDGPARLDRGRDLAQQAGDELGVARAYIFPAQVLATRREWVLADRYIQPGLEFCRERGMDQYQGWLTMLAAEAALAQGRWDEAVSTAAAILAWPARRFPHSRVGALVVSARVKSGAVSPDTGRCLTRPPRSPRQRPSRSPRCRSPRRVPRPCGWRGHRRRGSARRPGPQGSRGPPTPAGSPVSLRCGGTGPGWTAVTRPALTRTGWRSQATPKARPAGGSSGAVDTRLRWRWPDR